MESPVRDTPMKTNIRSAINRKALCKMDRKELEDRYVSIFDENIVLKKYGRKRDEEIKRLGTIQAKLEQDRKKLLADASEMHFPDRFYTEKIENQHDKIRSLEKCIEQLRAKLKLQKEHTSIAQYTNNSIYAHVGSRVDSGVVKHEIDPQLIKNIKMIIQPKKNSKGKSVLAQECKDVENVCVGTSPVIDNSMAEHESKIEALARSHSNKIREYDLIVNNLQRKMVEREEMHKDEIALLKTHLSEQTRVVLGGLSEDGRQDREKEAQFSQLLDRFNSLDQKANGLKKNNEDAVLEIENLNQQLRLEQQQTQQLRNQLEEYSSRQYAVEELETQVCVLRRECAVLKESNDHLVQAALETQRQPLPSVRMDIDSQRRETSLRIQLAQMEAAMKAELVHRENLLEKLSREKRDKEEGQRECGELKREKCELLKEVEMLKEKAALFDDDSGVLDHSEFIEALALVKAQNQQECLKPLVPPSNNDEKLAEIKSLKCQLKDAIHELEKSRSLLVVQYKLNKDYQDEMEMMEKKMEKSRWEMEGELDRCAQVMDIRAQRIRKLESQVKDIAYGTRGFSKISDQALPYRSDEDETDLMLEEGKNLFEIHISTVQLTDEGVRFLNDPSPSLFCTQEFYDFQLQTTPVVSGPRAEFKHTAEYVVVFDDFFIHYLHKDTCLLEVHHGIGDDYKTLGKAKINVKKVMSEPGGKVHERLQLKGMTDQDSDVTYAYVDCWVRLRVPMEQALRQYKERCKALGYLESNLLYKDEPERSIMSLKIRNNQHVRFSKIREQQRRLYTLSLESINPSLRSSTDKKESQSSRVNAYADYSLRFSTNLSQTRASLNPVSSQMQAQFSQQTIESFGSVYIRPNNSLEIIIIKCHGLQSNTADGLPSAYVIYKFFTFPDHVTPIIPNQRNPVFNDVCSFNVVTNKTFADYLRGEDLKLFVIDFSDPNTASYLGEASVSLHQLTKHYQYKELLDIYDVEGEQNGSIEVMFTWKEEYVEEYEDDYETEKKSKIKWKERFSSISYKPMSEKQQQKSLLKKVNRNPPTKLDSFEDLDEPDDLERSRMNDVLEGVNYPWSHLGADLGQDYSSGKRRNGDSIRSRSNYGRRGRRKNTHHDSTLSDSHSDSKEKNTKSKNSVLENPSKYPEIQNKKSSATSENIDPKIEGVVSTELIEKDKMEGEGERMLEPNVFSSKSLMGPNSDSLYNTEMNNADNTEPSQNLQQQGTSGVSADTIVNNLEREPDANSSNNSAEDNHTISINISHVRLNNGSPLLEDSKVKMLYVAYQFLGESPEETETPFSMPKPSQPDVPIIFNFNKEFKVDKETNADKRQYLSDMLSHHDSELSSIKFTLISEPQDDDDDCEDMGVAKVSLRQILQQGRDLQEEEVQS